MEKKLKTGGRTKGTPNQITHIHRQMLQGILDDELASGRIHAELRKLKGKAYLDAVLKLSSYILPKLQTLNTFQANGGQMPQIILEPI